MQRQCFLLAFYIYFLHELSAVACESNVTSVTCPLRPKDEQCSLCITARNASTSDATEASKLLDSYMNYQQIQVYESRNEFVWYFNNNTMLESRHITITFYVWNDNARFGISIPGCCRLPLVESNCSLTQPISGNIYYSLTLFRSTVTRHYKYKKKSKPLSLPTNSIILTPPFIISTPYSIISTPSSISSTPSSITSTPSSITSTQSSDGVLPPSLSSPLPPLQSPPSTFLGTDKPHRRTDLLGRNNATTKPEKDLVAYSSVIPNGTKPRLSISFTRPAPPATWLNYTRYMVAETFSDVCLFTLDKDVVIRNATTPPKFNLESHLFNRGVFSLPGFSYMNDIITNTMNGNEVECASMNFEGTSIFNFTSGSKNNDTFTCMVLWFTLNGFDELEVKCMPHNATYLQPANPPGGVTGSILKPTYRPPYSRPPPVKVDTFLIIVICSVAGGMLIFFIILLLYCKRKRINKLILSTKDVPETLKTVMNESPTKTFQFDEKIPTEKFTSFDELERQRIRGKSDLYKQQNITSNDFMLQMKEKINTKLDCGKERERTFNGYVEKNFDKSKENQSSKIYFMKRSQNFGEMYNIETKRDLSADSGISSGFSPLSEPDSDLNEKDSCDQVFAEVYKKQTPSPCRDSGLATSPIGSYSESDSPIHVLSYTLQNSAEIDESESISINNDLPEKERVEQTDDFKRIAPEYCKEIIPDMPLEDGRSESFTIVQNDNISSVKLHSKNLETGVYSKVHDFAESSKVVELLPEELPEINDLSMTYACDQQKELTTSLALSHIDEDASSMHSHISRDSFNKHCKLDCNYNDLPTTNINVTSGYSSKDAFVLPIEHVC